MLLLPLSRVMSVSGRFCWLCICPSHSAAVLLRLRQIRLQDFTDISGHASAAATLIIRLSAFGLAVHSISILCYFDKCRYGQLHDETETCKTK